MGNTVTTQFYKKNVFLDYLTTVDHKKIAKMYLVSGALFFVIAGIQALLMRMQLLVPHNDFVSAQTFNELLTMHGTNMLFFAATPLVFAFMNMVVPLQIGARDVAFPFLNALGFWLFFFGAVFFNISLFTGDSPAAGWTNYASLALNYDGHGIDVYVLALQLSGAGTLISGINFITTIITMRAPGMSMMRMPLFTWTSLVSSTLILFAFPPLTVALFLMMFDRLFGTQFFNEAAGGNTILYEHLFWIFGHPEVYLLALPAYGIYSEIIPVFSRKRLFGYSSMVFAITLIAFLGFMVWVHHMFTVGTGEVANSIFSVATMAIAVPTGIKIFNWLFTMVGGSIRLTVPMMYSVAFIPTFTIGGVTGVMLSSSASDYVFHDTYFVVAHFHYVLLGGVVFGLLGGFAYWFPLMFGKKLHEGLGKIEFWLFSIGFHLTFFIQHFLGLWGMPRRVFTYLPNQGLDTANMVSSFGTVFMAAATILLVGNVIYTAIKGEKVKQDPWEDGRTMEWSLPLPPPEYNFKQIPLVRGYDACWIEKQSGSKVMYPSEPLGEIHMPNSTILPFFMAMGLFISAFGFMYIDKGANTGSLIVACGGLLITFGTMFIRSVKDDLGYHVNLKEAEEKIN